MYCNNCKKKIFGQYITALKKLWHKECFFCFSCKNPFLDGKFFEKNGNVYCRDDYLKIFGVRCVICNNFFTDKYCTNWWGDSFCDKHTKTLKQCFSCGRLICRELTDGGKVYGDGRDICNICTKTAINDSNAGLILLNDVKSYLSGAGFLNYLANVPFRLTDQVELNKLHEKLFKRNISGMLVKKIITKNGLIIKCGFDEILALYGLPKEQLSSILAHEIGHVHLLLNGLSDLKPLVEEGFCEFFSYLWLKDRQDDESRYRLNLLDLNDDPVYGRGFKRAKWMFLKLGYGKMMDYLKTYREFYSPNA